MTSEYILEQRVLGPHLQLSIPEERYKELAQAREVLSEALYFEQRYELLLGNFLSLEQALTEIGLRATTEPQYEYSDLSRNIETANRHVVNLLTAMRSYADQVVQDFKCLGLEPSFGKAAKAELSKLYDRSFDYQFMYELRNYVQHKANAIHGFESGDASKEDANGWVEAVRLYGNRAILALDAGFKAHVLEKQPEKIDVRRVARRSVQGLGEVHMALRNLAAEHVDRARSSIQSTIVDYRAAGADSDIGLAACIRGSDQGVVPMLLKWDDVRLALMAKNASPIRLWPPRTHRNPKPETIRTIREETSMNQAQAASLIFVSPERWQDYEDGLPMPEGLFHLLELQLKRHKTHRLELTTLADDASPRYVRCPSDRKKPRRLGQGPGPSPGPAGRRRKPRTVAAKR
ncbi:hypothetical protein [Rhizobacter fulvus]